MRRGHPVRADWSPRSWWIVAVRVALMGWWVPVALALLAYGAHVPPVPEGFALSPAELEEHAAAAEALRCASLERGHECP